MRLCFDSFFLDQTERIVSVHEKALVLTSLEFDILWRLSEHPEHIFYIEGNF